MADTPRERLRTCPSRALSAALLATLPASCQATLPADAFVAIVDHVASDQARFCLASDGEDPTNALMSDIKARHPRVFAASECVKSKDMLYETPDGGNAPLVDIHGWRRTSPWHAKASVFHDSNFMFGSGASAFSLRLTNKGWRVTGKSVESIS